MGINAKVLMVLHMPPVEHGAAKVGGIICKSSYINSRLDIDYIDLGSSKGLVDVGYFRFYKIIRITLLYLRIFKTLIREDYKVLYFTPTTRGLGIFKDAICILIAKFFSRNILVHLHNKGIKENMVGFWSSMAYRIMINDSNVILQSLLLKSDFPPSLMPRKYYVVPNGISDEFILNNKRPFNDKIVILFLSNLFESKGITVFLEALKCLDSKGYEFEGRIIGKEGDILSSDLNSRLILMGLNSKVNYYGPLYGGAKFDEIINADILVYPTFDDCFPLVVLEALSCGLPTIASSVGGIPDMLDNGKCGCLVPAGDVNGIVSCLEELILNEELRHKISSGARSHYLKNFTEAGFELNLVSTIYSTLQSS